MLQGGLGCQCGKKGRIGDRPICRKGAAAGGLARDRAQALMASAPAALVTRIKPKVRGPLRVRPPLDLGAQGRLGCGVVGSLALGRPRSVRTVRVGLRVTRALDSVKLYSREARALKTQCRSQMLPIGIKHWQPALAVPADLP